MISEDIPARQKSFRSSIILRALTVLLLLLFAQVIITYGTFKLIEYLPASWTGVFDEVDIEPASHTGTVYLIRQQIAARAPQPASAILSEMQPYFSFPLAYLPPGSSLPDHVKQKLQRDHIAYVDDEDEIYAPLPDGGYLKLGPLTMPDIIVNNANVVLIVLALWFFVSVLISFVIIYLAFVTLWHEAQTISRVAYTLGEGDLTARVPRLRSEPLKMIGRVINDMAMRVELQVNHSKVMLHAMAHELRTPLARLRFAVTMLEDSDDHEKVKLYKGIDRDLMELENLIKVSLDYFRMNHKSMPVKMQSVKLKPWAKDVVRSLRPLQPPDFRLQLDVPDIQGRFDPELAAIALRNLLLNAFKYAHSQAVLHVVKEGSALIFELDDDGPGIPDEERDAVFSPFIRLGSPNDDHENGYGVGLSFVRAIAELHHGSALVLTSPLGGARFVMRFGL